MILLDTKNNIIGKPLGPPDDYISTDFYISCEALQAIYDAIIEFDISSHNDSISNFPPMTPTILYNITYCMDGVVYSINFTNATRYISSGTYPNLAAFVRILDSYYANESKSFPPASAWPT
jgi:hypothetical protein